MSWKGAKVFITGATGFIGSHLTKKMVGLGADVAVFVLDEEGEIPSGVSTVFRGNLQDLPDVQRALGRFQPEYVFHLAAQPLVDTALMFVADTLYSNVCGSINLLQACLDAKIFLKGVVFVSTDKVYGQFDGAVNEEAPLLGVNHPYNVSKLCADLIAQMYANVFDLPIVICRSGNIYGPGDKNLNRLVPGAIVSAIKGKQFVVRSDGKMTRDYIYVDDIVDAYLLLAETVSKKQEWRGRAVNFGATEPISVLRVVDDVLLAANRVDLPPLIMNTAKFEIQNQHLDWSDAKELGWIPKTNLRDGIAASIPWYLGKYG